MVPILFKLREGTNQSICKSQTRTALAGDPGPGPGLGIVTVTLTMIYWFESMNRSLESK